MDLPHQVPPCLDLAKPLLRLKSGHLDDLPGARPISRPRPIVHTRPDKRNLRRIRTREKLDKAAVSLFADDGSEKLGQSLLLDFRC